ncbi:cation diffusion facilitator family transporter [Radicibacter daui]|uniref:cation diffusion facilitator family transporter n=1 Tax=Radicibacter daui TaxID=3064829 RepID=UPI004047009A
MSETTFSETAFSRTQTLRRRAAIASVSVAVTLLLVKLVAVLITGSAAVLSLLLDSAADIAASGITLLSVREASKPADRTHRFGHGKAEALAALGQVAFVGGSGLFIAVDSVRRLIVPQPVETLSAGLVAMAISLVLTGALVVYQRHVIRSTASQAIAADNLNYTGDLATILAVSLSLGIIHFTGWQWVDPVMAMAVAIYLFINAARIALAAIDTLMDREMPQDYRDEVKRVVLAEAHVHGLHDLRTRSSGAVEFIEFHLEIDGNPTLDVVHEVMDAVEAAVMDAFPLAEVIVHPEPAGIDDARLDHRIRRHSA